MAELEGSDGAQDGDWEARFPIGQRRPRGATRRATRRATRLRGASHRRGGSVPSEHVFVCPITMIWPCTILLISHFRSHQDPELPFLQAGIDNLNLDLSDEEVPVCFNCHVRKRQS